MEYCTKEVDWYRINGRWPDMRIARNGHGVEYVIGDSSWNQKHQTHKYSESIEVEMTDAIKAAEYRQLLNSQGPADKD